MPGVEPDFEELPLSHIFNAAVTDALNRVMDSFTLRIKHGWFQRYVDFLRFIVICHWSLVIYHWSFVIRWGKHSLSPINVAEWANDK